MGIQNSLTHSPDLFDYMPLGEGRNLLPLTDQGEAHFPPIIWQMVGSMIIAIEEQVG